MCRQVLWRLGAPQRSALEDKAAEGDVEDGQRQGHGRFLSASLWTGLVAQRSTLFCAGHGWEATCFLQ